MLDKQLAACPDPANATACAVPQFNELTFPNNHTGGTGDPTRRSPDALVRDNDLAVGQLVDYISHSKIWPYSAIFVIQDDAQDGADHVEGHRIAALVASPYAKRHAVVSTHYDTMSVIATMERILGMHPSYLFDGLGAPMWDAFTTTPDTTPFNAVPIDDSLLTEHNAPGDPSAALSRRYVWRTDAVPEAAVNRMQWVYRYGTARSCPHGGRRGVKGNPCGLGRPLPAGDVRGDG
jgi:hypothetical protein